MNRTELNWLKAHDACPEAMRWLKKGRFASLSEAWPKCKRADWMMWLLWKTAADTQKMRLAALDIAETVLPIWEAWSQTREPHEALDSARRYLANPTENNLSALARARLAAEAAAEAAAAAWATAGAAACAAEAAAACAAEAAWATAWAAGAAAAKAARAAANRPDILRAQADIVRRYFPTAPEVKR